MSPPPAFSSCFPPPPNKGAYKTISPKIALSTITDAEGSSDTSLMCQKCVAGRFQDESGKTYSDYFTFDKLCTACPVGTYAVGTGTTKCTACPESFTTMAEGSTAAVDCYETCGPGKYQSEEPPGGGSRHCVGCAKGMYQSGSNEDECIKCTPADYTTDVVNATALSDCVPRCDGDGEFKCPEGKFSGLDPCKVATDCLPCPYGYYCPGGPATVTSSRKGVRAMPCSAGIQSAKNGLISQAACAQDSAKATCPAGSYCGKGTTTSANKGKVDAIAADALQGLDGLAVNFPIRCDPGKTCASGLTPADIADGNPGVKPCPPGFFCYPGTSPGYVVMRHYFVE